MLDYPKGWSCAEISHQKKSDFANIIPAYHMQYSFLNLFDTFKSLMRISELEVTLRDRSQEMMEPTKLNYLLRDLLLRTCLIA